MKPQNSQYSSPRGTRNDLRLILEMKSFVIPGLHLKSHVHIFVFYLIVLEELLHISKNQKERSQPLSQQGS
jgi:hypothetical protein